MEDHSITSPFTQSNYKRDAYSINISAQIVLHRA